MEPVLLPSLPVEVNGLKTRYAVKGNGPALLLIHGAGSYMETWIRNFDSLSEHFTVYTMDLPGHGKADKNVTKPSMEYYAEFIRDFMDVLKIKTASLLGHSFGASVVFVFGLLYRERTEKLILLNGALFAAKSLPPWFKIGRSPLWSRVFKYRSENDVMRLARACFYDPDAITDEWVALYMTLNVAVKEMNAMGRAILRTNCTKKHIKQHYLDMMYKKLPSYDIPTLILCSDDDKVIPPESSRAAKDLIPGAGFHEFQQARHEIMYEKPELFQEKVIRFLKGKGL